MSWDQIAAALVGAAAVGVIGYGGSVVQSVLSERRERRQRCRDAARGARGAVDALWRVYSSAPVEMDDLEEAAPSAQELVWDLRREGALICDRTTRERIEFVVKGLQTLHGIEQFGGDRERTAAWRLTRYAWDSLNAHLRGEVLPPESDDMRRYASAMVDYEAAMEEHYARH